MTSRSEKITQFLYDLKNGTAFLATAEDKNEIEDLLIEVLQTDLVKLEKEQFILTRAGIAFTSLGKTYDDYINESKVKPAPTFQICHLITGSNISNASVAINIKAGKQTDDKNTKQVVKRAHKIIETVNADETLSATEKEPALAILAKLIQEVNAGPISQSTYDHFLALGGSITSIGPMFIVLLPFLPKPITS